MSILRTVKRLLTLLLVAGLSLFAGMLLQRFFGEEVWGYLGRLVSGFLTGDAR